MNGQKKFAMLLCLCLYSALYAQDNVPDRLPTKADQAMIDQGEIENFKYQLTRFQAAVLDKDQESVDVLKTVLMEAMKQEIKQAEANKAADAISDKNKNRLHDQKAIFLKIEKEKFLVGDDKQAEKALKNATLFDDFISLMEEW